MDPGVTRRVTFEALGYRLPRCELRPNCETWFDPLLVMSTGCGGRRFTAATSISSPAQPRRVTRCTGRSSRWRMASRSRARRHTNKTRLKVAAVARMRLLDLQWHDERRRERCPDDGGSVGTEKQTP